MSVCRVAALLFTAGILAGAVSGATAATRTSFVPMAVTAAGTHVVAFSVGDFNGDGKPDLAVANRAYHSKTAVVLLGRGDGTFVQPSTPVKLSETPNRIMTADINGDGNLDAVVRINDQPESYTEHVSILLGNGAGALRPAPRSPVDFPELAAIADVNGDHKPDLVGFDDNGARIAVGLGDGTGHFVRAKSPAAGSRVAVADFNGDAQHDLVVGRQKNLSILLGTGSGSFAAARKIGWAEGGLTVSDFNNDGKLDLAVVGKTIAILLGNGAGSFSGAPGSPVKEYRTGIVAADVNGDGKTDIAFGHEQSVVTLLGDGTGRFNRAVGSPRLPFYPTAVAATDVNGDGKLDVVASGSGRYSEEGPDARDHDVVVFLQSRVTARPQVASGRAPRHAQGTQFRVRGAIVMFAADGDRAAVMATGGARGQCTYGYHVVVWDTSTRRAANIDRVPAPQCFRSYSADSNVAEFALGGNSVAWITESYSGNTEGHHDVFAAKLPAGEVRHIADVFGREDYDASGSWAGHLRGGGSLLAYNKWSSACDGPEEYGCSIGDPWFGVTGATLFRIASARQVVAKRGPGAYRLAALGGGRLAVVASDGSVTVLAPNGARVATVPANGDLMLSVSLSRTRLAVLRWSHTLDLYNARTGRLLRSLLLPLATPSDLAGVNARLALLRRQGRLVLVRVTDGRVIALKLARRLVGVTLTERGLFYAENVPHAGGRIVFEPNAALLKRF